MKTPEYCHNELIKLRAKNKYAKKWKAKIVRCTSDGYYWGWWEVRPLGIELGFWDDSNGREDLTSEQIEAFNQQLAELDK